MMGDYVSAIQLGFRFNYGKAKDGAFDLSCDLQIPDKGVTAIYGASGSGKTTL